MITPITNSQSNVNFNATLKAPKLKQGLKNTGIKIKDFGVKVKNEFKNLDEESKKYLYQSIILCSLIIAFLSYVGHIIKSFMDKINYLFE